jgi:hypothetical protein
MMDRLVAAALLLAAPSKASLADRSRIVKARQVDKYVDNGIPIEGPAYRIGRKQGVEASVDKVMEKKKNRASAMTRHDAPWKMNIPTAEEPELFVLEPEQDQDDPRRLSSQLTGCCYTYKSYSAANLCAIYGNDCESGETPSHDDDEEGCSHDGLSFIGISFSVNTANGNPYSYQLCDQFPMENIIDRNYDYIMSMDEDGWLVGGGYKTFDYSGKIPYIDSSHTELLRIGNLDPNSG